jgi:hypothetical protein
VYASTITFTLIPVRNNQQHMSSIERMLRYIAEEVCQPAQLIDVVLLVFVVSLLLHGTNRVVLMKHTTLAKLIGYL